MQITESLFIQVGNRRRFQVASFEEASALYCEARDRMGEGASKTPTAKIFNESGDQVARISYNGKVWAGSSLEVGAPLLFNPYA